MSHKSRLMSESSENGTVNQIELLLHPSTCHDLTKQYVCMNLVFTLNSTYPNEPPEIEIRNPRGLGEEEISSLVEDMVLKAEEMSGDAMLYTLIEMAKDSLTEGNVPHCPCVVCLEHFDKPENFHRTACYHYFHTHCLYKYLLHSRIQMEEDGRDTSERRHLDVDINDKNKAKKIICPVCRSPLDEESLAITCSPKLLEDDEKTEVFVIPSSMKEQQLKMSQLYEHQKAKGGIIDLELEKNKYLVNPDDRGSIRSTTVAPLGTSQDTSSKLPRKHDSGARKEDRSKQGSYSQQHRSRGRSWGRGNFHHGRSDRDRHGSKDKPGPKLRTVDRTDNSDSHLSGGSTRQVKEKKEEISEGRNSDSHPSGGSERKGDISEGRNSNSHPSGGSDRKGDISEGRNSNSHPSGGSERKGDISEGRNSNSHPSGGSTSNMKEKAETEVKEGDDLSEGKEVSVENGSEKIQESIEKMRRDHDDSGNDKIDQGYKERGRGESSEKSQQKECKEKGAHLEHGSKEFQKVRDRSDITADRYKHPQRGISARAYDGERGRGRFEESQGRGRHEAGQRQRDYVRYNYGVGQIESEARKEKRNEEANDDGKEKKSFKGEFLENKGRNEKYRDVIQSESSFSTSIEDEEVRGASGFHQSSQRGMNSRLGDFDDEYNRGAREKMTRYYSNREYQRGGSGYQRRGGGGGQRGRGSESGQKGSKFKETRDSHTEQSRQPHVRYERPHQQQSHQYHQPYHHHNRQGEERERTDRSKKDDTDNKVRDETISDSGTTVGDVHGAGGASSETVAQDDEEEADLWKHPEVSSWQSSTIDRSGIRTDVNMMMNGNAVYLKGLDFDETNTSKIYRPHKNDCSRNTNRLECNLQSNDSDKYIDCKDGPNFSNRTSEHDPYYIDKVDNDNNNWDHQCSNVERNVAYKSKIECNKDKHSGLEHNLQTNAAYKLNIEYNNKPSPFTNRMSEEKVNYIDNGDNENQNWNNVSNKECKDMPCLAYSTNVLDINYDNDNENWDDEIDIYAFERYKIRPEHIEAYDKQVAPRKKHFENKVKVIREERNMIEDEFRRIRNEELRRGEVREFGYETESLKQEKSEDPSKGKSVLELFKESQVKQCEGLESLYGNNTAISTTPDILLNNSDKFVAKSDGRLKIFEQTVSGGHSMSDESRNHKHASGDCHKKFNGSLRDQDVDRTLFVEEIKDKLGSSLSHEFVASAGEINPEPEVTEDYCRQFGHTTAKNAGNFYHGSSRIDSYQEHTTKVSYQGQSTNVLCQDLPMKVLHQGQSTKISGQGQSINISGQVLPMKILHQGQSTKASSNITKDVSLDTCHRSNSSANALSTKDEYLSSKSESFSSLSSQGCSLPSHKIFPGSSCREGFISAKVAADRGTLHKHEDTVHKGEVTATPQSFNSHLKKVPPLEFPKKNLKNTSNSSSSCPVAKTATVNDGEKLFPAGEASLHSTSPEQQVVGARLSSHMEKLCNLNTVPLQTTMPMLNTQLSASVSDLTAALLDSYRMSCLISANLITNYKINYGLDPTLTSPCPGSTGNMCLSNLYASNPQDTNTNAFCNSSSRVVANANSQTLANTTAWQGPTCCWLNNQPTDNTLE